MTRCYQSDFFGLKGKRFLAMQRVLMRSVGILCSIAAAVVSIGSGFAAAQEAPASAEILFVRRIQPLLREKCLACHGADPADIEGGLDLRSAAGLSAGGDSGKPAVVPGSPDVSPLYLAAARSNDEWSAMPPKEAERLTEQQLKWLGEWISGEALWPTPDRQRTIAAEFAEQWSAEDGVSVVTSGGLDLAWTERRYDPAGLWAYQPLLPFERPADAAEHTDGSTVSMIDMLIQRALPERLEVAPRADRQTLIRRATFDLTGLPPTPDEVAGFLRDARSDAAAFAELVDRLLQSPHYGERMAQHWLDVVRYADSSGLANDFERGNAWRYRDYVVRSFNADKPFDEFIQEQIAGDEIDPDDPEKIIATGFLRMGPWELTGMEVAKVARQRFLDDVTNSVGETFLGHSLQCARCHDHKFDPVPTRDYYSIQAVFSSTQLAERRAEFLEQENTDGFAEQRYLEQARETHQAALETLDDVMLRNAEQWFAERLPELSEQQQQWLMTVQQLQQTAGGSGIFAAARDAMKKQGLAEEQYPPKLVGFTPQQFGLERVSRKGLQRLQWEFERYQPFALAVYNGLTPNARNVSAPTRVPAADRQRGEHEQTAILTGGDPFSPAEAVRPGTLSVVDSLVPATVPETPAGRRAAFARWVADARNPLTPRVIANRIWQWHFGRAIAGNPNNFGATGQRPTHPLLLDLLAAELIDHGWSIKALHRTIMLSDAYCRSSQHPDPQSLQKLDPTGISLAVFQPRRLSAEELRDSMLAASGQLNLTLGGIPCRPEINPEVALQPRMVMGTFAAAWVPSPLPEQRHRRSLYVLRLRGLMDPMLEVFNSPAPDFSCERREVSTVTPQVFSLFNGQNSHSRALALAARSLREAESDVQAVQRCVQLALGRQASAEEAEELLQHWQQVERSLPEEPSPAVAAPLQVTRDAVEENTGEKFSYTETLFANADFVPDLQPADVDRHTRALADVCLVLFNCNEFVYVY